MKKISSVDEYIARQENWASELLALREILSSSGLMETIKWGVPVYAFNGKNVVGLAAFKNYVAIWFYQGALLKDEAKKLINARENKTKALRQ